MKSTHQALLAVALLCGTPLAHAAAANCSIDLSGDDRMQFDKKTVTVSASCAKITINLKHTGKLPAQAMGHNVVVTGTANLAPVAAAGMKAGLPNQYVPKGDARVLAFTPVIGGGAATKATFAGKLLKVGGDYSFFCSFPGHSALMKGKIVVTK